MLGWEREKEMRGCVEIQIGKLFAGNAGKPLCEAIMNKFLIHKKK